MKIPCNVQYLKEVAFDLANLKDPQLSECMLMIKKLEHNIHLGKALEDKNGMDLDGCYKIYFDNAKYRIVYKKIETGYEIVGVEKVPKPIAEIIAIGERNEQQVYKTADSRIKNK